MVLAVFMCLSLVGASFATAQWSKFQADLGNTGQASAAGPSLSNVAWTYTNPNTMTQNNNLVISDNGTIYFGARTNYLYAMNPDGALDWSAATSRPVFGEAIGSDGTIYAATASGAAGHNLYAFYSNGTQKWVSSSISSNLRGVTVSNGLVYVGCDDGYLYAFNASTGSQVWNYSTGSAIYGTPAVASDGTIYFGNNANTLYALNPNGTLKWTYNSGRSGQMQSGPSIGPDGTIYVGSTDGYLYAITDNGNSASQLWEYQTGSIGYSSPAVSSDGSTIYVGNSNGVVYALTSDGDPYWTYTTGGAIYSSPVVGSTGNIYIGSNDGKLYKLTSAGALSNSYTIGSSVYDLAMSLNGTLYAANGGTKLYAFYN